METELLGEIGSVNASIAPGEIGPVGAVLGPTQQNPRLELRAANALFLAPGVGAQGATPSDVARTFSECPDRVMPSASRTLLASSDPSQLRDTAAALAAAFRDALSS